MKKLLLILLCLPFIGFGQVNLHDWNNDFYYKYNVSTFQDLEIIHQLIDKNDIDYELFKAAIFYCTNIQRIKYGKKPFIHSILLERAAQDHSKSMVVNNFYSHTSPVRGKESMADRLISVGISRFGSKAENIFNKFESNPTYWSFAVSLVQGWMESSGHRRNILSDKYNYLGCGVYYYKNLEFEDYFWVKSTQNFSSNNK